MARFNNLHTPRILWYNLKIGYLSSTSEGYCLEKKGVIMIEKRRHQRIACATKCLLYQDDTKYRGMVENISLTGALVNIYRYLPAVITPGDKCSLLFCHLAVLTYSRFPSRIVRYSSAKVGLLFLIDEQ